MLHGHKEKQSLVVRFISRVNVAKNGFPYEKYDKYSKCIDNTILYWEDSSELWSKDNFVVEEWSAQGWFR